MLLRMQLAMNAPHGRAVPMSKRRFAGRASLALLLLICSCTLGYFITALCARARGVSGRSDALLMVLTSAVLLCISAMLCARLLHWERDEAVIAALPCLLCIWPLTAWIITDGTVRGLVRFHWLAALLERETFGWWLAFCALVMVPWCIGAFVGTIRGAHRVNP